MNTFHLELGSDVYVQEQTHIGRLTKIVINPKNFAVSELVVEEGLLMTRAKVFPISAVAQAQDGQIMLSASEADVVRYPDYQEITHEVAVSGWGSTTMANSGTHDVPLQDTSIPQGRIPAVVEKVHQGISSPDCLVYSKGQSVVGLDGDFGHVTGIVVDSQTHEILSINVRNGIIFTADYEVPGYLVERFDKDSVFIDATAADLS